MKKITLLIILMATFYASAQTCPDTLANQTTTSEPFFKIDQGTTDCADWPMTITIDGSVFEQTSCNGANLEYTLISGPPLADANNFVADFGFGECTYVDGALSGQTLSLDGNIEPSFVMYPNPVKKSTNVVMTFERRITGILTIHNANGLLTQNFLIKGDNRLEIDTSILESGIYFIQIETKDQRFTKKLVVY